MSYHISDIVLLLYIALATGHWITDVGVGWRPGGGSLPQSDVVSLEAALQRAPGREESGAAGVVAVAVDGGQILLGLELVYVLIVSLHPAA